MNNYKLSIACAHLLSTVCWTFASVLLSYAIDSRVPRFARHSSDAAMGAGRGMGMCKNYLGWGPNVTGLVLGGIFFGVYFGSGHLTRKYIMTTTDNPEPPRMFRDIRIVTEESTSAKQ